MRRNRELLDISKTNLALRGSEIERNVLNAASKGEVAWEGMGKVAGVFVWRIEKFQVVAWPKNVYGRFFDGDSFIVLHTHETAPGKFENTIYFWIGQYSSQDEYGTAAYKTVELTNFLDGNAAQHRECQGAESPAFLNLFPEGVTILEGGMDSGFTHVEAGSGNPPPTLRLFHIKGTNMRNSRVRQVVPHASALNEGDVFVLDASRVVYVFQGETCSPGERTAAREFAEKIQASRKGGVKIEVVTTADDNEQFWAAIGGTKADVQAADDSAVVSATKKLFRLSDASGTVTFTEVATGDSINKSLLDTNDVFILNNETEIFVWVGKKTTAQERMEAMPVAQGYLNANPNANKHVPITVMNEGIETPIFHNIIG